MKINIASPGAEATALADAFHDILGDYATRAALEAATVPSGLARVRVRGYTAENDGGGAAYRRASSEPSHAGKVQSADGAWWEIDEQIPTPQMFGGFPDGQTDVASAFQAAIDYVVPRRGSVFVPAAENPYYIGSTITLKAMVTLYGEGGVNSNRDWGSVLYHAAPATSLIDTQTRSVVRGFRIQVNNTDRVNPTATPPTIVSDTGYITVEDIRFEDAYTAVGSPAGTTTGAWVIRSLWGFVHHRMVRLEGTKDISWIEDLHSQNPDGVAWSDTWYSYNNKVLVEINDVDGIYGDGWFSYAGRGLLTHRGNGNLLVTLNNIGAEGITHGIEIAAGSVANHHITIRGGYLQTNNRSDGEYLISCEAQDARIYISGMFFGNSQNCDYIRVSEGTVWVSDSVFGGGPGTTAFRKYADGTLHVTNNTIRDVATVVTYESDVGGVDFWANSSSVDVVNAVDVDGIARIRRQPGASDGGELRLDYPENDGSSSNPNSSWILDVWGPAATPTLRMWRQDSDGNVVTPMLLKHDGDVEFTGNVGIGADPKHPLDINGFARLRRQNSTFEGGELRFDYPENDGSSDGQLSQWFIDVAGPADAPNLRFRNRNSADVPTLVFTANHDGSTEFAGPITIAPGSSVTPASNGDVVFELTDNTTLTIKAKGSDGTVRTGTITLS